MKKLPLHMLGLAVALFSSTAALALGADLPIPPSGVIGFSAPMMAPDYWIARAAAPNALLMSPQQIAALNARAAADPAWHDITRLDPALSRAQVQAWLAETGSGVAQSPVDEAGAPLAAATRAAINANIGADQIAPSAPVRYGLSVRRAQLRLLPTPVKAYPSAELHDFESYQGGILLPGEAVVIAHASVDGQWLFVVSSQGPAWVARGDVAEGPAAQVLGYAQRTPFRVVTGDAVRTVFTPEAPALSELQLDMGVRLPLAQLAEGDVVNGQVPYLAWTVDLPFRRDDGTLAFKPALVQKIRDTAPGYLPLTRANIIRQAFKFLGERYGWGHLYNGRDCSGLTSEVYRSMGVFLLPNAGAQGQSSGVRHRLFGPGDSHQARLKAVLAAQPGDLVVVPGHVLMIIGQVNGEPYVIQDVPYAVFFDRSGKRRMTKVNGVSVTPLLPLLADEQRTYVDAMTSLVQLGSAESASRKSRP